MTAATDPGVLTDAIVGWVGARPGDLSLYAQALTHGSAGVPDYQRLEFLGDRVLGLTLATHLYTRFPDEPEGGLSSRFHALVSGASCALVARRLGLPKLVRLGKQARDDGGRDSDNIAADVMEALIGAIYLDHGANAATRFILTCWTPLIEGQVTAPKHPKSALQEWAAANQRKTPDYGDVSREGPAHAPRFVVTVRIPGLAEATGEGSSKGAAEAAAASAMLEQLGA